MDIIHHFYFCGYAILLCSTNCCSTKIQFERYIHCNTNLASSLATNRAYFLVSTRSYLQIKLSCLGILIHLSENTTKNLSFIYYQIFFDPLYDPPLIQIIILIMYQYSLINQFPLLLNEREKLETL